jgi:hypothetical protein
MLDLPVSNVAPCGQKRARILALPGMAWVLRTLGGREESAPPGQEGPRRLPTPIIGGVDSLLEETHKSAPVTSVRLPIHLAIRTGGNGA